MKRILLILALSVIVLVVGWNLFGGSAGLVGAVLPPFPDYPAPPSTLTADHEGTTYFASHSPFDFDVVLAGMGDAVPTTGIGTLIMPERAEGERVPAMVVLHGSGGINPGREVATAERLARHGIAAFVIDYYASRGVGDETNYMLRVLSVTEFDAMTDAYAARALLATHPGIDPARIGVMGFSYGGMAARFAMDERVRAILAPDHAGFAAFIDYYGPCFQDLRMPATNRAPLLTLRGTEDASNDNEACRAREAELQALGVPVEAIVYPGAGHAWDSLTPKRLFEDSPYVAGCTVVYDEDGSSSVDGQTIVEARRGTTREERVAARAASGGVMSDCVGAGYVVGRDEETLEKSNRALIDFVDRVFPGAVRRPAGEASAS